MKRNETVSGDGGGKKSKHDEFIAALLTHSSVEAAAKATGISRATGWRWLQHQDVIDRLRQARQQAWSRAMAQLQEAGPEAVEALRKIMREAEGESPRVSAAKAVLELGIRAVELESIEDRLGKLEALAKTTGKDRAMNNLQIERRLDRLEESMGTHDTQRRLIRILLFGRGEDGKPVQTGERIIDIPARESEP